MKNAGNKHFLVLKIIILEFSTKQENFNTKTMSLLVKTGETYL